MAEQILWATKNGDLDTLKSLIEKVIVGSLHSSRPSLLAGP